MHPTEPLDILRQTRELIADPRRHTRNFLARDGFGNPTVDVVGSAATQWCVAGAMMKVVGTNQMNSMWQVPWASLEEMSHARHGFRGSVWVNNELGHQAILADLDATIAKLEGAQGTYADWDGGTETPAA